MARRLISVRRKVEDQSAYDRFWRVFLNAALAAGAKAWRFHAAGDPELFLEFLEFDEAADPRRRADLRKAIDGLDSIGGSTTEEWTDANLPPEVRQIDDAS